MKKPPLGFTLIEVLLVIALVGVIAGFGTAMSLSSLSRASVSQERDLFVALLLRSTRAAAVANLHESSHGVRFDNANHRYILFRGDNFATSDPITRREIPYTSDSITIENTGGDTIVFTQLSGNVPTGEGTVSISNGVSTSTVTIRSSGQIDW